MYGTQLSTEIQTKTINHKTMNKKDQFIISGLNQLGLGINAVIPDDPQLFAGRIMQFFKGSTATVWDNQEKQTTLKINDDFLIHFKKEGKRVVSVEIQG